MYAHRVEARRIRRIKPGLRGKGPVVYWMSRDQRVVDNWALLHAQDRAVALNRPLMVVFCLVDRFLNAAPRHYRFLLAGLGEVDRTLQRYGIGFQLLTGEPKEAVAAFLSGVDGCELVVDFDPLKIKRSWLREVTGAVKCPVDQVDAHNIVPCWLASDHQEYGARTLRPNIVGQLDSLLTDFPQLSRHPHPVVSFTAVAWQEVEALFVGNDGPLPAGVVGGESAGRHRLADFIRHRLPRYAADRNDPNLNGQSGLSPYLHFGQLAAQRVALAVSASGADRETVEVYLEELVVRRELADNFCNYNANYDRFEGFPAWARETLNRHRRDRRPYLYELEQLEQARTHEKLWNAAQMQMVMSGRMHGYLRMYWAKKLLEWSPSPEDALQRAIFLNDRYSLDGRDPNGYTGVAWSIGGVHDRAWPERPVFGKVRYMNEAGCRRKFDVPRYIDTWLGKGQGAWGRL